MEGTLIDLHDLVIHAEKAEVVTWQGRQALRLENGLAVARESEAQDASIEVMIGTEGPAYPGVAFHVADVLNYELAYAVPHVSGQWDALQYDPVFHGSNTWQLYYGPGYQGKAQVPTGRWFQLKVETCGSQAAISVDGQAPLFVEHLAHSIRAGRLGLWTYRPAYFCDWRVSPCTGVEIPGIAAPGRAEGVIEAWFLEGYGALACEPNGVVNLNRCLPNSVRKARLIRRFETSHEADIAFEFGFSDVLSLELDGEVVYKGENKFTGFTDRAARGYAELGKGSARQMLPAGSHLLAAELEESEGFGWGMVLAARGEGLRWLPAELG
jgi:hypothetical protein